jgi:hypothetical protein
MHTATQSGGVIRRPQTAHEALSLVNFTKTTLQFTVSALAER